MDIRKMYQDKLVSASEAAKTVKSGDWVDYAWTTSTPVAVDAEIAKRLPELYNVNFRGGILMWVPEIFKIENPADHFTWNSWHMSGIERKAIAQGFAFYGPMGYDIGNVIGNLFFAWANKAYNGGSAETQTALAQTIRETCDKTAEKLAAEYDKLVTFPLYRAPAFRKAYLDGVMADSYGYAGTEIIRRVVGDSKVMEVTSVTDPAQRLPMERALIDLGIYLIKNRAGGLNGAAVTEEFRKILAEGRGTHGQNG